MASIKFKFALGDQLECTITGFKGIAVAVCIWTNGCIRYTLQSQELKDGKPMDTVGFDEQDLRLVKPAKAVAHSRLGGARPEPTRPEAK